MRVNPVVPAMSRSGRYLVLAITLTFTLSCSTGTQTSRHQAETEVAGASLLERGRTLQGRISGGEKHVYQLHLAEGDYARVQIDHDPYDLVVRLVAEDGRVEIERTSDPGAARTVIELAGIGSGARELQVEPRFPLAPSANYRIRLRALRRATEQELLLNEARTRATRATISFRNAEYDEALLHAEQALKIFESTLGHDQTEVISALTALGVIHNARGQYDSAELMYGKAMAIAAKHPDANHFAHAEVANHTAKNATSLGAFDKAERLSQDALRALESALGKEHFLVAVSLVTVGDVYLSRRDFARAEELFDRALELAGRSYPPEATDYQQFAVRAARVQTLLGNFARAEELLNEVWSVRQKLEDTEGLAAADALTGLAFLHLIRQDNVKAVELTRSALQLKEKILGADHPQNAGLQNNLGLLAYRMRDYAGATRYYERALTIIEKTVGTNHFQIAQTMNNLGLVAWRQGDYPRAQEYYQRTLERVEAIYGHDTPQSIPALTNLGIIYKESGDYARAESYYKRSLAIGEKAHGPSHPDVGHMLESLGILYRDRGDYALAEPLFLRALEITTATLGPEHRTVVRHLKNLEHLYSANGDPQRALLAAQRLIAIEEKHLPLNLAIGSERQKFAYFGPYSHTLEKLISFHVNQPTTEREARDLAAETLLRRKGRILDAMIDSQAALRSRSTPEDLARFVELNDVTSRLAGLVLNGPKNVTLAEHQDQVDSLSREREAIEAELSRITAGQFERPAAEPLGAVTDAIPEDAVLIEFAIYSPYDPKTALESDDSYGEPCYIAYVLSRNDEVRWKDLGTAKEMDDAIAEFRRMLRGPERRDVMKSARALDEMVMRPIRALFNDPARLLISPDGQLALIPFEALVDEDGRYLIENYSVSYLSSGRDLLRMQVKRPNGSGPIIIADPSFGEPEGGQLAADLSASTQKTTAVRGITTGEDLASVYFAPLSGTAHEARSIKELFPEAELLTRSLATEASIRTVQSPSILHIATHGFFLEDPVGEPSTNSAADTREIQANPRIENPLLRSGLALSGANLHGDGTDDGIFTALEAASLNLWGTKLVTLSACDTGVGEVRNGEGVFGLRRAFFLAGTETLVMSLWPVSDSVTRQMMTSYYTGLKNGLGRGEALRQSQLAMLKRGGRRHPFYWASFIQSGEWADLNGRR